MKSPGLRDCICYNNKSHAKKSLGRSLPLLSENVLNLYPPFSSRKLHDTER